MRAGKGQEGGILPLLALPFNAFIVLEKWVARAGKGYNNMDQMDNIS